MRSGMRIDPAAIWGCFGPTPPALSQAMIHQKTTQQWTGTRPWIEISAVATYPPVFYIPAAIGLGLAKALGALPFYAIYTARLAMFACYALLGGLALLLARRGQAMIFLTLSMPMALSLGASCNPDGILIATSALGAALLSRGAIKPGALCLAFVIFVKPPYALLGLLLWLPLSGWRATLPRRVLLSALIILPGALWLAYAFATSTAPRFAPALPSRPALARRPCGDFREHGCRRPAPLRPGASLAISATYSGPA